MLYLFWYLLFSCISRAETILSGVIVRPDPQDPNSTRMSLMLQNDIKGWIPHFVVNLFVGTVSLRPSHHTVYLVGEWSKPS